MAKIMLDSILICNSAGLPYYSRVFRKASHFQDAALLSGLISAVDSLGRIMFSRKVGIINYVEDEMKPDDADSHVVIMSKDLMAADAHLNFVFFVFGAYAMKDLRALSTSIFMELKKFLRETNPDYDKIQTNVDHIIETQYPQIVREGE
jgi:hypothetical protein